jgi:hypothetical protein
MSETMKWSELRERVLQIRQGVAQDLEDLIADIDAAAPAMERQERDAEWARSMRKPYDRTVEDYYDKD